LDNIAFVDGIREGLWDDAIKYIRKAAEIDPQNSEIIAEYAHIEYALRNYTDASQLYERAHQIDPDNYSILLQKAYMLTMIGKKNEAQKLRVFCSENTKSKLFLINIFTFQWWFNYYNRNFKLAKIYADSITSIARMLGRNKNTQGFRQTIVSSQAWAGSASYFLKDKKGVNNYFTRVIPAFKNFKPHLTYFNIERLVFLAMSQAYFGQKQAAITNIRKAFELEPEAYCYTCHYYHIVLAAAIYALYRDANNAIPLLKEALTAKGTGLSLTGFVLRNDPAFDYIRSNPGFQRLLSEYPKDY
jgi:tetratricopeptide (TPR) repeat protein